MSENLTSSQILHRALSGNSTDRVPCICPGGMMNMLTCDMMQRSQAPWPEAHINAETMAQLAAFPYEHGIFDNIGVPFCMTVESEAMGAKVDLGDLQTEPRITEYAIHSVADWRQLPSMDFSTGRARVVLDAIDLLSHSHPDAAIIGNLTGPISTAASITDADLFYRELRKNKADAHDFVDFVTGQLIAFGKEQIRSGAEFIAISDPSGTGEILGPKLFEEYALPALNAICRELKPLCKGVIIHICGQLRMIYPQLSQLECSALSVDAVVNVRKLHEALGDMPIMGNVSTFTLANGEESTIRKMCRASLAAGVNILAPACGLGTTSRMEHIGLMMQCAKQWKEASDDA